jgi:hypothetical protein
MCGAGCLFALLRQEIARVNNPRHNSCCIYFSKAIGLDYEQLFCLVLPQRYRDNFTLPNRGIGKTSDLVMPTPQPSLHNAPGEWSGSTQEIREHRIQWRQIWSIQPRAIRFGE